MQIKTLVLAKELQRVTMVELTQTTLEMYHLKDMAIQMVLRLEISLMLST